MNTENPTAECMKKDAWTLRIYRADPALPTVYIHMREADAEAVAALCSGCCTLVCIDGTDWNRDFSPWAAPRIFRDGEDFSGGADAYLLQLRKKLLPAVEETWGVSHRQRAIAGYSLAGLFALYAMYRCPEFSGAASISGSLWYDGFAEYVCTHNPAPGAYYLSLGNREHRAGNPRMASVRASTDQIAGRLAAFGHVCREENQGGHFTDPPGRTARGIRTLCRMLSAGPQK